MAYAPRHEEEIPHRPLRRRMEVPRATHPAPEQAGATSVPRRPRDPRRGVLRAQERLSLAAATPRLPALGDRLPVVREVAHGRDLRTAERRAARAAAEPPGQEPAPERGAGSRAFRTCGWTPATRAGASGGPRRFWARASRSCASRRSRPRRRWPRGGRRNEPRRRARRSTGRGSCRREGTWLYRGGG
jgi:hypothetical protein